MSLKSRQLFRNALVQLTVQYTVLLLILFSIFSSAVYLFADHTFGGDYPGIYEVSDSALDRLRNILLLCDTCLVVILPFISYWLARRALRPVQLSYEEQQRFVDNASHELRTPLSIVQGELELAVQKERSSHEYIQAIRTSLEEVSGLNDLVSDLLLVARGSQPSIEEYFVPIMLDSVVQSCGRRYQSLYKAKKLRFTLALNTCEIIGSPELVTRCVANILDNACKFSNQGGQITIALDQKDSFIQLHITDEGVGMQTYEVSEVYNRFWRSDEARTIKGHGLGLAIVKQIVELHHGKIEITSAKNRGTRVVISLPVKRS